MSEEILVNVTPRETRVAVVENGMLQELHIERGWSRGVVGNIYKGKVQRVMPGMQAAFVEIGLERAAFLHASDILRLPQEPQEAVGVDGNGETSPPPPPQPTPSTSRVGDGRWMSLACRNAVRSSPISTNAACIPGITRCTRPL